MTQQTQLPDLSPEVAQGLREGEPVVALESTIISHGMPYPQNVETALQVEQIVRDNGAVPATIAILDGRLKAGLSPRQIDHLGKRGPAVAKVSRRDIPVSVARKQDGAATVATTMIIAAMAGIRVFCTGGIGGVHRGAARTMDISADLQELAKTQVLVVCAGAKSILDIGLTLEYLETQGVAVFGYGTDEMPAFFTRESGFRLVHRTDTPADIAEIFHAKCLMGLDGGVVVANPIPKEYSMDGQLIEATIQQALADAGKEGITGKEITPYLLDRINERSGGKSLEANIRLVKHNARLSAQIAVELARITREESVR